MTYHHVESILHERDCEYCGVPLRAGSRAFVEDGRSFCCAQCAHRFGSHDAHRRRISETERLAFFPATIKTHGRAVVRAYERS